MVDKIVSEIKINTSGTDGQVSGTSKGTEILRDLLDEFKGLKNIFQKVETLSRSGLGGGGLFGAGASGGLFSSLLGGAGGMGASLLGMLFGGGMKTSETGEFKKGPLEEMLENWFNENFPNISKKVNDLFPYENIGKAYEKIMLESGEEKILEIDQQTGEILRILTLEEAKQEGILNVKGRIKDTLETQNSIFDTMTKNVEKSKDATFFTSKTLNLIEAETQAQLQLQKEITALLAVKAKKMGGSGEVSSDNLGNTSSIPFVKQFGQRQSRYTPSTETLNKAYYSDMIKSSTQEGYLSTAPLAGFIDLNLLKK